MVWVFVVASLLDVVTTFFARKNGATEWNPLLKKLPYKVAAGVQLVVYSATGSFLWNSIDSIPCIAQTLFVGLPTVAVCMNLRKFFNAGKS